MNNINNLGLHTSLIQKIIQFLRSKFFNAIYQVLLYDNQTIYITIILSVIQLFQLIYLSFAVKTVGLWQNDDIARYVNQFLGYFTILLHIMNTNFEIFLALLYFSFSLIVITIMLIFFVGIMDKETPIIVIKTLGYIIKFLTTIGYFPLMQIFFGYLACHNDSDGIQVMVYLKQQTCWTSDYAIHSIFAIIGLILSQGLISLIVLICYQSKQSTQNAFSQRTGRSYQYFHYGILVNIMTYQLLDTPKYMSLIITVFLITSYFFFHIIKNTQPFHNKKIQTLWVIISAINFWTDFMLAFAAILEGQYFGKSIYAWLIGIPFLTIIILREPSEQIDLFAANINPHEDGDKIIQLCEYLLNMVQTASQDFYIQLELDAYIEVHKHSCPKPDCVLKNKKQSERKKPGRQGNQILLDVINQIFFYGIKQFPTDIHLRLHYAYFLIDYLKAKQLALTELQQAELSNDSFDFEFIIYRFKKIIEEEIQIQQQENAVQLDLSNEMTFLAQSKLLANTVEQTALLFIDFWSQLQEEIPDTGKLLYIGSKIQYLSGLVETQWKRIKKLNQKHKKLYLLMAKYYQQVWNDDIKSQQLFEIEKNNKNSEFKGLYILEEMGSSPQAILVCYTEGESLGIIQSINKAASSLLGYTKTDLIGRHLNILLPEIYQRQHTSIMNKYLEYTEQENQLRELKPKTIYAKTKSHYIIQCFLQVKMIQTQNQEIFLMAQISQDIQFRPFSYLICQQNGIIDDINSMCVKILGIDHKILEMRRPNVNDLFPNFMDLKEDYQTRQGEKLIYTPSSKISKDLDVQKYSQENISMDLKQTIQFNCQVTEITFNTLTTQNIENRVFGYIIRLEQLNNKQINPLQIIRKLPQQSMCFRYTPLNIFTLEKINVNETNENSMRIDSSIIWESAQKPTDDSITQEIAKLQQHDDTKDLSYGIRTVRLIYDRIVDIDDQQQDDDDEVSQNNQMIIQSSDDQDEDQSVMQLNHYQSKQSIEMEIKKSKIPSINNRMQIFVNFLFIGIIVCIFLEYFLGVQFNDNLTRSFPYLRQNNERIAVFLLLQSVIQDIKLIYYGFQPLQQKLTNNTFLNIQQTNFIKNIALIQELQQNLSLAETSFIQEYKQYEDIFKSTIVEMKDLYGNSQNYTISESIQQMISTAIALNDSDVSLFSANNSQVYYFEYNSFNSLAINQYISQQYYYYNILSKTSIISQSVTIFLIGITLIVILLFIIQSCYFYQIHRNTQEIIQLFLDIKDIYVKQIYYSCELFLTGLQIGDDDINSELDDKPIEKNEELMLNFRPKRRKHKNSNKKFQNHLVLSFTINLLIFLYFLFLYFQANIISDQINQILPLLNATSYAECYSRFADNALRQYFFDPNFPIYHQNGLDELKKIIVQLYTIDSDIHDLHTETWNLLEDQYKQAFFDIFINNPCSIIASMDSTITENVCNSFYGGIIENGLSIAMTKFIEDLRLSIINYEDKNISSFQTYKFSDDPDLNFRINLLNTGSLANIRRMQRILIRACYKYLISIMEQTIVQHLDQTDLLRLAVFLSINIIIIIVIILIWLPVQLQNNKDIIQTRLLILIIPLDLILRIKSIKNYLRNKIFH